MSKNIVICHDGTWNKPDKSDAEICRETQETNVCKLYEICVNDSFTQVAYYDKGIGTEWWDKKIALLGFGLSENIRQAYQRLASQYEKGDKVFLFGFSRGAYSARSLAGLIYSCGLLPSDKANEKDVYEIYEIYREGSAQAKQQCKSSNVFCPVEMLGVWDTVGALGFSGIFGNGDQAKYQFHNVKLNPEVKAAYHALALDEERELFTPTLWDEYEKATGQIVEQVWFAGVHCDIGGGYPEAYHSDIAFRWMLEKAVARGLKIRANHGYIFHPDLSQDIHDSYKKVFGSRKHRKVPATDERYAVNIHWSVLKKVKLLKNYRPAALTDPLDWNTLSPYRIVD